MLRKTYDWVMSLAARPQAPAALGVLAFCEGLFFPIPPDVLLMPVVLGDRERALRYAAITIVCSIAGGSCGYAVGYFLQPVGRWILSLTGGDFEPSSAWYGQWGALLIAVPIPYKITAIASGMAKLDFGLFLGGLGAGAGPALRRRGPAAEDLRRADPRLRGEAPGPGGQRRGRGDRRPGHAAEVRALGRRPPTAGL